MKKKTKVAVIN